jgi:threonine synthase
MNHKDKALRVAFKAFRMMSRGAKFSEEDLSTLSDLCGIALPVKYRFSRAELDAINEASLKERVQ